MTDSQTSVHFRLTKLDAMQAYTLKREIEGAYFSKREEFVDEKELENYPRVILFFAHVLRLNYLLEPDNGESIEDFGKIPTICPKIEVDKVRENINKRQGNSTSDTLTFTQYFRLFRQGSRFITWCIYYCIRGCIQQFFVCAISETKDQ